ncbi:TrgA family protein [Palleronia sp. KMU-117]|uniref:TrgA family protein n=1 Tax=Palleronia sp. KMU-117 TaxID=3434108 RepID=UPI003D73BD2E
MPTAAKLIGAIVFAALAWFVSDLIKPLLPEGSQVGLMSPVNAFFGLIMGWRIMGRGAGNGYVSSWGYGLTTLAAIVFWCLLLWSGYEMTRRAMRLYYDGPMEALQEMAVLMAEYARIAIDPQVIGAAVIGALLGAMLTEFFSKRWA